MAVNKKTNEAGWFYHAPAKRVVRDKVDAPAPSQIPGIGFDQQDDQEEVREMMFRDTDSDYIRLAKMGGRKDLLSFNPEKYKFKPKNQSQRHHRSDWFYLEDNRMEAEEQKQAEDREWEFLLPEYMVHKGYNPSFSQPGTPPTRGSGAPYYTEPLAATEGPTDKAAYSSKIPEPKKEGYGVRNQKPPPKMQPIPPREKPLKPESASRGKGKQQFSMPAERQDPTNMMKLMAGEYERDWHRAHSDYEAAKVKQALAETAAANEATSGRYRSDPQAAITAAAERSKARQETEKELFKLQRFKNVPSKVDTHQRAEIMAAVK